MMTIWFIYPYGPIVDEKMLDFRYVRFGKVLAEKGYRVVWWTTNYSHGLKQRRCKGWKTIEVCTNFTIELVPVPSYKKNISIRRVFFELFFAKKLGTKFKKVHKPDLIMTSGTGLFSAFRPVWPYMKKKNVPVIYDIMDVHLVNAYMTLHHKLISPGVKLITWIASLLERKFYNSVSGVCALGRNQLEIALDRTGNRDVPSCLVYNGIYVDEFRKNMINTCLEIVPKKEPGWIYCIFAGALGPSYDIETVIKCAQISENNNDKIKFLIAGSGPQAIMLENAAKQTDRVVFLGQLAPKDLIPIYGKCDVGLCTYAAYSTVDMPDKFYDYCAGGMAIVNSLQGEVKEHVLKNSLGYQYVAGDAESLYECISKFKNKDNLNNCKKNAYSIGEQFDMKNFIIPLVNMIDELTDDY